MLRRAVLLGISAAFVAASAHGAELVWPNGKHDLHFQAAGRCTLLVRATGIGETLPSEWLLSWTALGDTGAQVSVVAEKDGGGAAFVCDIAPPQTTAEVLDRLSIANFCAPSVATRSQIATYVLDVAAGIRASFHVVPVSGALGQVAPGGSASSLEATLNGGSSAPYSPEPLSATITREGDVVTLWIRGADLGGTSSMTYVAPGDFHRVAFPLFRSTDSVLVGKATVATSLQSGRVEILTAQGLMGAIAISAETPGPGAAVSGDALVVRFRSGAVTSPGPAEPTAISQLKFAPSTLEPTLAAAGVTTLEPIFPWFKHSDVRSTNLIGEPIELDDLADYYWAHTADGTELGGAARTIASADGVMYAGLDYGGSPSTLVAPNDPLYGKQWTMRDTSQVLCGLSASYGIDAQAYLAWGNTKGDPDVRVAIIDTGIDTTHVELSSPPRVRAGPAFVQPAVSTSFDDDLAGHHGTAIAGILAATGNNGAGIAGLGWLVTPWAVKVIRGSDGFSRASWAAQGIACVSFPAR